MIVHSPTIPGRPPSGPLAAALRAARWSAWSAWEWYRGRPHDDFFNIGTVRNELDAFGLPAPDPNPAQADEGPDGAMRYVVGALIWDRALRQRFPHALSGGRYGKFCRWLTGLRAKRHGLSRQGAENVRAAFAAKPGGRLQRAFEARPDLPEVFPLGLTPAGRDWFLRWALEYGRNELGLTTEQIFWLLLELDELPDRGLVASYRVHPQWQARYPHALTRFGWDEFRRGLAKEFDLPLDGWLGTARLPRMFGAWDEAALLAQATPEVAAPMAETVRTGNAAPVLYAVSTNPNFAQPSWWWKQRLRSEVRRGLATKPGINLLAHWRYNSGLRELAVQFADAFHRNGFRVARRDIPIGMNVDTSDDAIDPEQFPVTLVPTGALEPFDAVYRKANLNPRSGVHRIAMWAWELADFPPGPAAEATLANEFWAPSEFAANAIRRTVTDRPVYAMLPGVSIPKFRPVPRSRFGLADDRTLFLFAFDMASVMERKNPLGLITAFRRAFRRDDRAQLAIKITRGSVNPSGLAQLTAAAEEADVRVIDEMLPREESFALMAACDCYVSLHRAEGFGFTVAEAMLLGKPVISTDYSSTAEFLSKSNGLPVDYRLTQLDRDYHPYPRGAIWADPSVEHAAELMRWVYERPADAQALGAKAKADAERVLSPQAAGRRAADRVRAILAAQARAAG